MIGKCAFSEQIDMVFEKRVRETGKFFNNCFAIVISLQDEECILDIIEDEAHIISRRTEMSQVSSVHRLIRRNHPYRIQKV